MAKSVNFTVKLKIDGKEVLVEAGADARRFAEQLGMAKTRSEELKASLMHFNQVIQAFNNFQNGLQSIGNVLNNLTEESRSFSAAMKATNTMAGKEY